MGFERKGIVILKEKTGESKHFELPFFLPRSVYSNSTILAVAVQVYTTQKGVIILTDMWVVTFVRV